jgi:hypothetical protein
MNFRFYFLSILADGNDCILRKSLASVAEEFSCRVLSCVLSRLAEYNRVIQVSVSISVSSANK